MSAGKPATRDHDVITAAPRTDEKGSLVTPFVDGRDDAGDVKAGMAKLLAAECYVEVTQEACGGRIVWEWQSSSRITWAGRSSGSSG
jgi:hypothetical protein